MAIRSFYFNLKCRIQRKSFKELYNKTNDRINLDMQVLDPIVFSVSIKTIDAEIITVILGKIFY